MSAPVGAFIGSFSNIAMRVADAAAEVTLRHFRARSLSVANKEATRFDPVTVADQDAEAAMRAVLATERPDDGVIGEEVERTIARSGFTWIVDPIDGTRSFISGVPVWGTLIALDDGVCGRIGIIDQPFLGERYLGIFNEGDTRAELHRADQTVPIATRSCTSLDTATLFTTDPYLFTDQEAGGFAELRHRARMTRFGVDCYAYALLASGHVDLVVESGLQAYDIAAHIPLVQAAGGVVTDWRGDDCRWGGRAVAAGDPAVHDAALEVLAKVP